MKIPYLHHNHNHEIFTINPGDPGASGIYVHCLSEMLDSLNHYFPPLVVLCIGSDRSTGDSLGPLVGSMLTRLNSPEVIIYGTLEKPVHALNLAQTYEEIKFCYPDAPVLAVDSSLGNRQNVGCLQLGRGCIRPGAGVHKSLPEVGDFFITGIVNVGGFMEYMILQSTRLGIVFPLSRFISTGIIRTLSRSNCGEDRLQREDCLMGVTPGEV